MYRNNKEMLKILILIILVIAIPLVFISLEAINTIRMSHLIDSIEITSTPLDDLYQNIVSMQKNSDASDLRNCLIEMFELMNKKDFNTLYGLLTDDIKKNMFPRQEDFSDYMEKYLGDELYSPKFSTYQKLNKENIKVFILNVNFIPHSTKAEDISLETKVSKTETFTIYLNDDLTYKFSFLKYIGCGKDDFVFENDIFSCKLTSTHLYTSQTTFNIEFTNKSDKDIFIDSKGIYVVTGVTQKPYSPSTFIQAKTTSNIHFTIYTGLKLRETLPTEIRVKGVHANGKVYFFTLPIEYPVETVGF